MLNFIWREKPSKIKLNWAAEEKRHQGNNLPNGTRFESIKVSIRSRSDLKKNSIDMIRFQLLWSNGSLSLETDFRQKGFLIEKIVCIIINWKTGKNKFLVLEENHSVGGVGSGATLVNAVATLLQETVK